MSVGMPAELKLDAFASKIIDVFGVRPYHVGSSLMTKSNWRDVDIRVILSDQEYENLGLGDPNLPQFNHKWVALCLAFSALGKEMTGLPIDFQIQQQTLANTVHDKPRGALGMTPDKMKMFLEECNK